MLSKMLESHAYYRGPAEEQMWSCFGALNRCVIAAGLDAVEADCMCVRCGQRGEVTEKYRE